MRFFLFLGVGGRVEGRIRSHWVGHWSYAGSLIDYHNGSDYLPPIESRTSRPTGWMEIPMKSLKNLMFAALAALSLSAAVVPATSWAKSTIADNALATETQRLGAQ
jgi:hypothetical protein